MNVHSPAFVDGQEMDQKYGKKIDNVSLPVAWDDAPSGTKSFAIVMVDRDNHDYAHWMLVGLSAETAHLAEGAVSNLPTGAKELKAYAGPFPPSGTHRYEVIVFALDTDTPPTPAKTNLEAFTEATKSHVLAQASISGMFTKQRG